MIFCPKQNSKKILWVNRTSKPTIDFPEILTPLGDSLFHLLRFDVKPILPHVFRNHNFIFYVKTQASGKTLLKFLKLTIFSRFTNVRFCVLLEPNGNGQVSITAPRRSWRCYLAKIQSVRSYETESCVFSPVTFIINTRREPREPLTINVNKGFFETELCRNSRL